MLLKLSYRQNLVNNINITGFHVPSKRSISDVEKSHLSLETRKWNGLRKIVMTLEYFKNGLF